MIGLILAVVAVWLWFCLVSFGEYAPMTGAVLLPIFLPLVITFALLEWCFKKLGNGLYWLSGVLADAEKGVDK